MGGGLINYDAGGALSSDDNSIAGTLTPSGSNFTLTLTRLNGANVSINLTVSRVTRARWTVMVFLNAANDLQEFIAYAKANEGKLQFGSAGVGSAVHLGCVLFNAAA